VSLPPLVCLGGAPQRGQGLARASVPGVLLLVEGEMEESESAFSTSKEEKKQNKKQKKQKLTSWKRPAPSRRTASRPGGPRVRPPART
jgi:hypothetical protein